MNEFILLPIKNFKFWKHTSFVFMPIKIFKKCFKRKLCDKMNLVERYAIEFKILIYLMFNKPKYIFPLFLIIPNGIIL